MKKFFMFLAVAGILTFTANIASAQDEAAAPEAAATEQVAEAPQAMTAEDLLKGTGEEVPFHQQIKSYFIQGGPGFMSAIILCLILGLFVGLIALHHAGKADDGNTKKGDHHSHDDRSGEITCFSSKQRSQYGTETGAGAKGN